MAEYYSLLPQNAKQSAEVIASSAKLREMRTICENVEMDQCNSKLNESQIQSYHFQMIIYLICDELSLAKFLFKRVPKEVREKASFVALWDIGCSQYKGDHISVYDQINKGKWSPIVKPFMEKLESNYRMKQVELVSNAYTSITVKELLGNYLGFSDVKQLKSFIKENDLSDVWTFDNEQAPTKVTITKKQENYQQLLDASKLMSQFTKYVCFMESQQKLSIDEMAAASNNKN